MGKKRRSSRSGKAEPMPHPAPVAPIDPAPQRLPWSWAAGVAALAFVVRAAVAVQLGRTVLYRYPQLDSLEFLRWAQSIAGGGPRWAPVPTHGPGYPYLLSAMLALFDGSFTAVRLVQAALGAATCVLAALVATRLFDRRAGLAAGVLLALYGPLVYVETAFLAEGLLVLLLTAALWALLLPAATPRASLGAAAAAGLLLGLAAAVRATALPLIPALAVVVLLGRRRPRRGAAAAALAGAALVVVLPVLVQVRQAAGSWLPMQGFGGLNLYMGNRAGAPGVPTARLGGDWDRLSNEPLRRGITGVAAQERWFTRRALGDIRRQPLGFLRGLGRKALWLLQDEEIRESHSFYFFRGQSRLLAALPGWAVLFPLALCGLALAAARRSLPPALAVYLVVMAASCIGIVVSSRYRLPLVPALAALAGGAAVRLVETARARRWRELAPYAALLAAGFAVTQLRDHAPSRNLAEEWAMTATSLEAHDDLAGARQAVEKALAADPQSALAWAVAGRLAERDGDLPGAERAFATAARLAPDFHRARLNLGSVLKRRGDLAGAQRELRRALWLFPGDVPSLRELGEVLLVRGQVDEAERLYRQVLERDPESAAAYLALARIAGSRRRPDLGFELASTAARLQPRSAEAWVLFAMLALDAGNAEAAREALGRTQELLGPEAPAVGLGWAMLDRLEGRPDRAEARLRDLLAREPRFDPAARLLLATATERGRRAEAEAFLRRLRGPV